jgi:hypothetical protein
MNYSSDFPTTTNALLPYNIGVQTGFVSKVSSDGKNLLYSTHLGGSNYDEIRGIALDGGQNIYVTGLTASSNFTTTSGVYS